MLWGAQLPRIKKIGLIVLFSGAIFVMVAGILRCVLILQVSHIAALPSKIALSYQLNKLTCLCFTEPRHRPKTRILVGSARILCSRCHLQPSHDLGGTSSLAEARFWLSSVIEQEDDWA